MNREEFEKFVEKNIISHLPWEYREYSICRKQISEGNLEEQMVLEIRKKDDWKATIYPLKEIYESYRGGEDLFFVMEKFAEQIEERQSLDLGEPEGFKDILDYNFVKEHLQMRLYDRKNPILEENRVVTIVEDYVITYQINLGGKADTFALVPISKDLLDLWKINENQLYQDALEVNELWNQPLLLELMEYTEASVFGNGEYHNLLEDELASLSQYNIYLLTNKPMRYGAAQISNAAVLEKIGNMIGSDYWLIPSSVNELVILSSNFPVKINKLEQVFVHANFKGIAEERINSIILHYDCSTRRLEKVEEQLQIQKEKNRMENKTNIIKETDVIKPKAAIGRRI